MTEELNIIKILSNICEFFVWLISIAWPYIKNPIFLSIITAILIVGLLYYLYKKYYENWNSGWLSDLIETTISKSSEKQKIQIKILSYLTLNKKKIIRFIKSSKLFFLEIFKKIHFYIKNDALYEIKLPYMPSKTWLIIFIFIFGLFFFFSHDSVPYKNILDFEKWHNFISYPIDNNQLPNIIAILCGFASMVFVLIIFIAESIRATEDADHKRVLLKVSNLWPLITFTTLSLLNFLWFKVTALSIVLPIIIAVGIIFSFWQIVNFFINPEIREKYRKNFLKERMQKIILESVKERIGNNILLGKIGLDKEIKLEYKFSKSWINKRVDDYFFIESKEEGWLYDINLIELANLIKKLSEVGDHLGINIYPKKTPFLKSGKKSENTINQSNEQEIKVKEVYLLKRYGEQLLPDSIFNENDRIILALPKEFKKDQEIIADVYNLMPHIFRFNKKEPLSKTFRRELQNTKDQLINAIKSFSLGSIDDLKQTYLQLAETFLEQIYKLGGGFSAEQAKRERGNIFEEWDEISWLNQDIRELINVASETDNNDVMSKIAYLPMAISMRAIQVKDHFLFQEFVNYSTYFYHLGKEKPDNSKVKPYLLDRSWRFLKNTSDYYIEPKLNNGGKEINENDIKEYKYFLIYIFRLFQNLLKSSFDKEDLDYFKNVLKEFSRIYKHFNPEHEHPNVRFLKQSLEWTESIDEKINTENKIIIQQAKEDLSNEIKLAKEQIRFGLASKIFDIYKQNQNKETIKTFFETLVSYITDDIGQLTHVYESSRNFSIEDRWGWNEWEMIYDGEAHSIDFLSKLDKLYCILALKILKNKNENEIDKIIITPTRNLVTLSEEQHGLNNLITVLNSMVSESDQWNFILDEKMRNKISDLKKILQKACEKQEKIDEEYLKNISIDKDKLEDFKTQIKESFYKSGYLRPILEVYGAYRDLTSDKPIGKMDSWGFNQIADKEAFIKDWHVHYLDWGEHYGRSMATSEDQIIFKTMVSGSEIKKDIKMQDVIPEIEKILNESNFNEPIILQTLDNIFEYENIRKSETFIPRYNNDCPQTKVNNFQGYIGILKYSKFQIPVVNIFIRNEELKNKILLTDIKKYGSLNQYSPIDNKEESKYKDDIFFIKVIDLNEDEKILKEIIDANPNWLKEYEDKEGYLRRKVVIKLFEKFEFKIIESKFAYCINVETLTAQ